ncbi:disulfide bond formation protein B [Lacibacterium aquatile]|uniref:Disulfide bond formation protein B n=1 Tax=Lacibacterium aquatile TaxID=1168082 RepID=A0ABW5DRT6_9PROT
MTSFGLRARAFTLAGGSLTALLVAFLSQIVGGLQPCILCLYQRWPYVIAIAFALIAGIFGPSGNGKIARLFLMLAGLALLTTAGIGVFHVGVEHGWWTGTAECGNMIQAGSIEDLRAAINNAPVVRCDQAQWTLLGISIAGYNVLYAVGLAIICLFGATQADADRSRR